MKSFLHLGSFDAIVSLVICLCVLIILLAVMLDFGLYSHRKARQEKKSMVDTGTMLLFFMMFYFILKSRVGLISLAPGVARVFLMAMGSSMVVAGCIINITGRLNLGSNWANQIKIYPEHHLVQTGMYRGVRHPLYASIILMFYGACLAYQDILACTAVTVVFIPFMVYRAKQEETLLIKKFPKYEDYQRTTGMFFPRIVRKKGPV